MPKNSLRSGCHLVKNVFSYQRVCRSYYFRTLFLDFGKFSFFFVVD